MKKIPFAKMPAAKGGKAPALPTAPGGLPKPHIRTRKLRPVSPGAFPVAPMAFPPDNAPPSPDQTIGAQPGGMPTGAAPGDMGG